MRRLTARDIHEDLREEHYRVKCVSMGREAWRLVRTLLLAYLVAFGAVSGCRMALKRPSSDRLGKLQSAIVEESRF